MSKIDEYRIQKSESDNLIQFIDTVTWTNKDGVRSLHVEADRDGPYNRIALWGRDSKLDTVNCIRFLQCLKTLVLGMAATGELTERIAEIDKVMVDQARVAAEEEAVNFIKGKE